MHARFPSRSILAAAFALTGWTGPALAQASVGEICAAIALADRAASAINENEEGIGAAARKAADLANGLAAYVPETPESLDALLAEGLATAQALGADALAGMGWDGELAAQAADAVAAVSEGYDALPQDAFRQLAAAAQSVPAFAGVEGIGLSDLAQKSLYYCNTYVLKTPG